MSTAYRLPKSLKNIVVAAMQSYELDPGTFDWDMFQQDGSAYIGEQVVHRPTESSFHYYETHNGIWTSYSPAINAGAKRNGFVFSDNDLANLIKAWLQVVKREDEAPDLWAAVRGERAFISGDVVDGELFFTRQEQYLLAERLDQLEAQIRKLVPDATPEDVAHTHASLEHAKAASTRVSRIDWKSLFVGKLFDVIIRLGLEPQKAQHIFHYATMYIGPFISRALGLPQ